MPSATLLCLVLLSALPAACGGSSGQLVGAQRLPVPDVSSLSLPEAGTDADFVFRAAPGGVLLVYFGYTYCPDVCPTTLAELRVALSELGRSAERVQLAMATIDPARDTPEQLATYVRSFVPGAHALVTTDDQRLRSAADAFGADYSSKINPNGEREVAHTGSVYAVDDTGALVVTWTFGTAVKDVVHDLKLLLRDR